MATAPKAKTSHGTTSHHGKMSENLEKQDIDNELEAWKEICRDLQHRARDIKNLCQKIEAFYYGDETVTVSIIEIECRNYLTAANQGHAAMRRVINNSRGNSYYSHKQVIELEKNASETIGRALKSWEEMLSWVPQKAHAASH